VGTLVVSGYLEGSAGAGGRFFEDQGDIFAGQVKSKSLTKLRLRKLKAIDILLIM
jgi:hypothetical protein